MDNYRGKQKKFNPQNNWEKILKGPKRFFFFKKKKALNSLPEQPFQKTYSRSLVWTHLHLHPNQNPPPPSSKLKPNPTLIQPKTKTYTTKNEQKRKEGSKNLLIKSKEEGHKRGSKGTCIAGGGGEVVVETSLRVLS